MGHKSTEYVVAEIVQACADGRLELKAPSGALNQTPGEPCWYPHEFVSNGAMQRHELLLARYHAKSKKEQEYYAARHGGANPPSPP